MMMTGMHTVADIFCVCCGSIVGWKYETAHEKSQKYKEGKSVLERFKICGPDGSHYWASHDTHVAGSDADGSSTVFLKASASRLWRQGEARRGVCAYFRQGVARSKRRAKARGDVELAMQ
ncbi:hypothetical protein KY285_016609 [Solanum tuberosum]|nr:hypothetical protein KY284_016617 [Solanum tuberosum]KAH0702331.1 hypothetical protein KY285_016609 [Solanum tuberosum]